MSKPEGPDIPGPSNLSENTREDNIVQENFEHQFKSSMDVKTHLVRVSEGVIRGCEVVSPYTGQRYYSFQGIRYAKPPIGPLRFQPPVAVEPWDGIYDALKEGNICPQKNPFLKGSTQSEDCLFLNVYTPSLSSANTTSNSKKRTLPVMFWIHGGANIMGTGNSCIYGPDYLIQHDVILVTINYRLGIFGYLSLNSDILPGNMALKDQILALKWVQRNIEAFDGDRNNVTAFGESTGAINVNILSFSPAARGLFHRAIIHSGSALMKWGIKRHIREDGLAAIRDLGCSSTNDKEILKYLLKLPTNDLLKINKRKSLNSLRYLENHWKLTIESPSPGAVLTEDPEIIFQQGHFHRMPCIIGVCSAEGLIFNKAFKFEDNLEGKLNEDITGLFYDQYNHIFQSEPQKIKSVDQMIRNFYFNNKPISKENRWKFAKLFGEFKITYHLLKTARYLSQFDDFPVYLNLYDFNGKLDVYRKSLEIDGKNIGSCHTDELAYVFPFQLMNKKKMPENTPEAEMISRMTKWWTNFAKSGDPNSLWSESLGVIWRPITKQSKCYLKIDKTPTMKENVFQDEVQFWDTLYHHLLTLQSKI